MYNRKTHLTGTIQTNRIGLPLQVKGGKLKLLPGEHVSFCKGNCYNVLCWRDRRYVTMLSTFYSSETKQVRRIVAGSKAQEVNKSVMISECIDRADQYCSSYGFVQKTLRWWRKLYFFVLEISIVNSFILYKELTASHVYFLFIVKVLRWNMIIIFHGFSISLAI